jgi:hypothetical protein
MMSRKTMVGALALAAGTVTAAGVPGTRFAPPPGLYRIEIANPGQNGAAASPQRICVKPYKTVGMPEELFREGCTFAQAEVVGERKVTVNSCPWGKVKISLRQLDANTWESALESARGPARAPSDFEKSVSLARAGAEKMASSAEPQERARGENAMMYLKIIDAYIKTRPKGEPPPEVMAAMRAWRPGVPEQTVVQRLIRLGDCPG